MKKISGEYITIIIINKNKDPIVDNTSPAVIGDPPLLYALLEYIGATPHPIAANTPNKTANDIFTILEN